ncbi:MAG: hypothetical protein H7338_16485 [Candidatus Sericytochromatia bacterium]|nr:hypothetical protein [Candidatus Sericytochromatia bacterium]
MSVRRPGIAESLVLICCAFWGPLIWIRDALGGWWDLLIFDNFVYPGMFISLLVLMIIVLLFSPLALFAMAYARHFSPVSRASVFRVTIGLGLIVFAWATPHVPGRLEWAWRHHKTQFELRSARSAT